MPSARKLGFAVGQLVWTGAFPAVLIGDINTETPMCEVWGFEQESGSVFAKDLKPLSTESFIKAVERQGHQLPLRPWSERAVVGLEQAGVPVERR